MLVLAPVRTRMLVININGLFGERSARQIQSVRNLIIEGAEIEGS